MAGSRLELVLEGLVKSMVDTDSLIELWLSRKVNLAKKDFVQTARHVIWVHGHRWTLTGWPPTPAMLRHIAESAHLSLVDSSSSSVVDPLSVLSPFAATCRVCSMFMAEARAERAALVDELDALCADSQADTSSTEDEDVEHACSAPTCCGYRHTVAALQCS